MIIQAGQPSRGINATLMATAANPAGQMKAGQEVLRGLLVARCDCSKMLDGIEETLDDVALAIKREVAIAFDFPV